jgi:hypothetical protein
MREQRTSKVRGVVLRTIGGDTTVMLAPATEGCWYQTCHQPQTSGAIKTGSSRSADRIHWLAAAAGDDQPSSPVLERVKPPALDRIGTVASSADRSVHRSDGVGIAALLRQARTRLLVTALSTQRESRATRLSWPTAVIRSNHAACSAWPIEDCVGPWPSCATAEKRRVLGDGAVARRSIRIPRASNGDPVEPMLRTKNYGAAPYKRDPPVGHAVGGLWKCGLR